MTHEDIGLATQAADFIVKYGFLAVGLALVFLVAPTVYKIWKAKLVTLSTVCIGITFIVAYGVIDILQKYAPRLISSQRPIISGEIFGLKEGFQVSMRSDIYKVGLAYTKRVNDETNRMAYNVPFVLVTSDAPTCLSLNYFSVDPNSTEAHIFNFTSISKDDMAANIELSAQLFQKGDAYRLKIWRERDNHRIGDPTILDSLIDQSLDCGVRVSLAQGSFVWPLIAGAFAQSAQATSIDDWAARLRSGDPFTRLDARVELTQRGTKALQIINQLLDRNDYVIQLGAVGALSAMPEKVRTQAPPDLLAKVRSLSNSSDQIMRDTALAALFTTSSLGGAVVDACERELEAHKDDNSGFVRAVAADFGITLHGLADDIVAQIQGKDWTILSDGVSASEYARKGYLVIGGLKGSEQRNPTPFGHVVIVVDGSLAHGAYPRAYWGFLGGGFGRGKTVNFAWASDDRDRVTYSARRIETTGSP
jgi:hypothetical protein